MLVYTIAARDDVPTYKEDAGRVVLGKSAPPNVPTQMSAKNNKRYRGKNYLCACCKKRLVSERSRDKVQRHASK